MCAKHWMRAYDSSAARKKSRIESEEATEHCIRCGVGMTAGQINQRALSYGYDCLLVRPVFLNDTIRARASIKEKRDDAKRKAHGIVVEALEVINQ